MPSDIKFGIVQGRLIKCPEGRLQWFPQGYWESEFFLASALGYHYIELIAERNHNENNPIWSARGIEKLKCLGKQNCLCLHVLCNDYIIDHSLEDGYDAFEQTIKLIARCKLIGIQKVVLPMFEKSEVTENNFEKYKNILIELGRYAQENDILVCLETVLDGMHLLEFLKWLNHTNIKCVFDTGNRIAFGHDIYSDIVLLGDQIRHIHIKDKNETNENVLLGTGKVNFYKLFKALSVIGYAGPYTFETFRGKNPIMTAKYNKMFIEFFSRECSERES